MTSHAVADRIRGQILPTARVGLLVSTLAAGWIASALPAIAQTCPRGYKALAGICVASCPAGYEDTGSTCEFRRQGGGGGGP